MTFTLGAIGTVSFVLLVTLFIFKEYPWWQMFFGVVAGLGLGGTLGRLIGHIVASATRGSQNVTLQLAGTAVPAILAILGLLYLWITWLKPNATPHRYGPWIALCIPGVLALAGGTWLQINTTAGHWVTSAANGLGDTLSQVLSGL